MRMYHKRDTQETSYHMNTGKTGYITTRVEPRLKASAGRVLTKVGGSTSDASTMFLRQIGLQGGLPFDVRVPNAETKKAIRELETGAGKMLRGSTKEIFDEVIRPRKKQRI